MIEHVNVALLSQFHLTWGRTREEAKYEQIGKLLKRDSEFEDLSVLYKLRNTHRKSHPILIVRVIVFVMMFFSVCVQNKGRDFL